MKIIYKDLNGFFLVVLACGVVVCFFFFVFGVIVVIERYEGRFREECCADILGARTGYSSFRSLAVFVGVGGR